eukprot:UN00945
MLKRHLTCFLPFHALKLGRQISDSLFNCSRTQLSQNRQNGSLPICVLISDGQPTTRNYMNVVRRLKEAGVIFVGVLVMPFVFHDAQEAMFEVATCDGYAMSTCPNYVLAQNFQELKDEANQLASEVAST